MYVKGLAALRQLVELAHSSTGASATKLVLLGEKPFHINIGEGNLDVQQDLSDTVIGSASELNEVHPDWIQSFISVPLTGPGAEAGWLAIASDRADAFDERMSDSVTRISSLIEQHLDRTVEHVRIDQLSATLQNNRQQLQFAKEQLAATNSELEQFAYIAAHELVAPLRTVSIYAEVLENICGDSPVDGEQTEVKMARARQCTTAIRAGVTAMNERVQYLLDFSKAAEIASTLEPVDLDLVVHSALDTLAGHLEESDAVVNIGELPQVNGRITPLQSVFANLIANAVNYRDPDRQLVIDIRSELRGNNCRITVQDNGVGIDESDRTRVFQLFERASVNTSGSGIGLALTRRIVEAHGGTIGITDSPPVHGTAFWIDLPQIQAVS